MSAQNWVFGVFRLRVRIWGLTGYWGLGLGLDNLECLRHRKCTWVHNSQGSKYKGSRICSGGYLFRVFILACCQNIYVIFLGGFSVSCHTPGVRLCFRNIFSVGTIVTDAHLTMYSVLFPSLFSHIYYSSLSLMQKLHSHIKANHVVNQLIRGEGHPGGCLESRIR